MKEERSFLVLRDVHTVPGELGRIYHTDVPEQRVWLEVNAGDEFLEKAAPGDFQFHEHHAEPNVFILCLGKQWHYDVIEGLRARKARK